MALPSSMSQCLEKISLFQGGILGLMWLTEQHWEGWNSVPNCAPLEYECCAFRNLLIFRVALEGHCHQCSQRSLCWWRWLTGCGLFVLCHETDDKDKAYRRGEFCFQHQSNNSFFFFYKKINCRGVYIT